MLRSSLLHHFGNHFRTDLSKNQMYPSFKKKANPRQQSLQVLFSGLNHHHSTDFWRLQPQSHYYFLDLRWLLQSIFTRFKCFREPMVKAKSKRDYFYAINSANSIYLYPCRFENFLAFEVISTSISSHSTKLLHKELLKHLPHLLFVLLAFPYQYFDSPSSPQPLPQSHPLPPHLNRFILFHSKVHSIKYQWHLYPLHPPYHSSPTQRAATCPARQSACRMPRSRGAWL